MRTPSVLLSPGAFGDLIRLKELVLRSNRVAVLRDGTWEGLGSLDKLDLAHNELRIIRKGLWRGLDHVTELDLGSNHIEVIQDGGFANMLLGEQFSLKLTDNQLTLISETSFHPGIVNFKSLVLDLSGNPFKCDADMCWLRLGQAEGGSGSQKSHRSLSAGTTPASPGTAFQSNVKSG